MVVMAKAGAHTCEALCRRSVEVSEGTLPVTVRATARYFYRAEEWRVTGWCVDGVGEVRRAESKLKPEVSWRRLRSKSKRAAKRGETGRDRSVAGKLDWDVQQRGWRSNYPDQLNNGIGGEREERERPGGEGVR
jgi:hypothetical protein